MYFHGDGRAMSEVQYLDQTGGTEGKGAQQPRMGDDDDDDE